MRRHYDFANAIKNSYARRLKKQVTLRLEQDTLEYFKGIAVESDIPYQKLINLFLRECAEQHKKPSIRWEKRRVPA